MKTNAELRAAARARLGGGIFGNNWMLGLLATVIFAILSGILSSFAIGALFIGPLTVGLAAFFLIPARGGAMDIANMTYAIKNGDRFTRSMLVEIFTMLFTFLWALLFIIPGIVKSYSYALAPYLAVEREDLDARACLDESQRLMDGHKWQLFILDLSFIGWMLVGILCCCIGIYFVEPYRCAARAEFYCALTEAPKAQNEPIDTTAEDIPEESADTNVVTKDTEE